jgi:hypothetical protein
MEREFWKVHLHVRGLETLAAGLSLCLPSQILVKFRAFRGSKNDFAINDFTRFLQSRSHLPTEREYLMIHQMARTPSFQLIFLPSA